MSKAMAFLSPMPSHSALVPITPAAGPDSSMRMQALLRLADIEQPAGRLHDQEVAAEARVLEMVAHLAEIAPHARTDIGVGGRRRGALELAIFLRQLVRGGDEELADGSPR